MLGPTVQREKDTTHKTFETMFIARAWPQQCRKSCANGSNVVALRFGDQGIKEMLGVVGLKVWPVSKLCATHAGNNMQQGVQTDATTLGVVGQQCCVRLHAALQTNFSVRTTKVHCIKSRQKGHQAQKASSFSNVDVFFLCNVFFLNCWASLNRQ